MNRQKIGYLVDKTVLVDIRGSDSFTDFEVEDHI